MEHRRRSLLTDGAVPLSATVGTALHFWQNGFAMLNFAPVPIDPATLAAMGRDLLMRGQTCWHIRADGSDLRLDHVAYWDELAGGKFYLHIAHPNSTKTRKALADEVLKLTINADPRDLVARPFPVADDGPQPPLIAEIERAVSNATAYAGKGLLPMPSTIPEEQQAKTSTDGHN